MKSSHISPWGHVLLWLAITSLGVAVGMGVSAFWHRFIQESTRGPREDHILPLMIVTTSAAAYLSVLWSAKRRRCQ